MEEWQSALIVDNIVRLINLTSCDAPLVRHLLLTNTISPDEGVILEQSHKPNAVLSKQLYELLLTRKNSYTPLLEALKDTNQTDAFTILNNRDYYINYKEFFNFKFDENYLLGEGCFGTKVYGGSYLNKKAAVKYLNAFPNTTSDVYIEIQCLLSIIQHKNVVPYLDLQWGIHGMYIAMERCHISLQDEVTLKLAHVEDIDLLTQCTIGLDHLHRQKIIHGNLKPSNVLIFNKTVKISDFGLTNLIPREYCREDACPNGKLDWLAPEILRDLDSDSEISVLPNVTFQSDVFALGCVFYFTLTQGGHPFGHGLDIRSNIEGDQSVLQTTSLETEWRSLIERMICKDVDGRPSPSEILLDKVFPVTKIEPWAEAEIDTPTVLEKLTNITMSDTNKIDTSSPTVTGTYGRRRARRRPDSPTPSMISYYEERSTGRRPDSPIPDMFSYYLPLSGTRRPASPTPSFWKEHGLSYRNDMYRYLKGLVPNQKNSIATSSTSTSEMELYVNPNHDNPPDLRKPSNTEITLSQMPNTPTPSVTPPLSIRRPSNFSFSSARWRTVLRRSKRFLEERPKKCGWKTRHLSHISLYLAHNIKFRPEFFQDMRRRSVLSEFYFNKCMHLVETQETEDIFTLPFVRNDFYDHLKSELRKTYQQQAYAVLEDGPNKMEQWTGRDALDHIGGYDSLAEAIQYNCDVSLLQQIFSIKERKNLLFSRNHDDSTLLHVAVQSGHIEAVKYLLKIGIGVNSKNTLEHTPLHHVGCCGSDAVKMTRLLLAKGADVAAKNWKCHTVAVTACLNLLPEEYHNWVKYMIKEGHAHIFLLESARGNSLLHEVVPLREISKSTIQLLSSINFDFSVEDDQGSTVHTLAAEGGQSKAVLECIANTRETKATKLNQTNRCIIL